MYGSDCNADTCLTVSSVISPRKYKALIDGDHPIISTIEEAAEQALENDHLVSQLASIVS